MRLLAPLVLALALGAASLILLAGDGAGAAWLLWPPVAGTLAATSLAMRRLATGRAGTPATDGLATVAAPLLLGALILFLWEVLTRGGGVLPVLLPPPSAIGARFAAALPVLAQDAVQTFGKAVLAGYALGCATGFATALAADRSSFLRRGLTPLAALASALPLVGIAPIAVMWFGFDWQSKAAVVTVMTFFPMFVGTTAGLAAAGRLERDLMRSWAASYRQSLFYLRLPAALPFIFGALKLNSTLALIGAIVAEFFGTPTVGMGFRISIEVGRMNLDMVWAEIALAAVLGTGFYASVAVIERLTTAWHPSFRASARS